MNILQLNNYHFVKGGADRCYFEVSKLLEEYGHNVLHFSIQDQRNVASSFSSYFGKPMSFEVEQSIRKKAETAFRMLYSFSNNKKVKELLSDYEVDVAHAHNIYNRVCPSVLDVLKKKGIPIILTLHDYKLGCPRYTFYRDGFICNECLSRGRHRILKYRCARGSFVQSLFHWIEAKFHNMLDIYAKNVAFFICPSLFCLRQHAEIGIKEKKLIHIPNFVNISAFEPSYNQGDYILFAGILSKQKGVMTLLKAAKGLDIPIKIVGEGPMREEYETYAREYGMHNVIFEGYKRGQELKDLFRNSLFLIFPSEWFENAPMSILEASAYGKPVIGSNIGGIPEMLIDGKTGLLFDPKDDNELKEKIGFLLSHPSLITEMGKNGRQMVEKEYNPGGHYQKLMKVYQEACS
jgi:glycosyltransferase involved in cell wall biosynthesis